MITLCIEHRATPVSNEPLGEKVEEKGPKIMVFFCT